MSFDSRTRFIQLTYLCTAPSRTTYLVQATAPVSACLQPTQCLAARTGRGEVSKAGKHTSSKRLYDEYETRYKKMLYFVETTHEVAETVIFRQNIPVDSINVLIDIYFLQHMSKVGYVYTGP